ncbi:GAF domain-containing protein [Sphingomonas gilva]|uniref:GAF domain-containing protein n=1 Tax=Sphingomonas gilva TaxID=2305907 RepID=A0A396RLK2_9SPHN|nr:GAF domain-containing protein [Sphingomonas gilva]RHW17234.1 GAF domain-containing protein [Sphingomonas gilva]
MTPDEFALLRDDDTIRTMLEAVCRTTRMGFAAVARVTEEQWIACQVADRIEFGLDPGDELAIKTTICDDIRRTGKGVIIDDVDAEQQWRTHPVPILYGFKSYISLPIIREDGSVFGTICAIDPEPRTLRSSEIVAVMEDYARRIAAILDGAPVEAEYGE